jgi:glycolate dehydrogenase FAD-binding subunit
MSFRPRDESDLSEAVAAAKGPLRIVSGGTRQGLGHPVAGETLEMGGLSGITVYEPGALTLVAKAGTPLTEIEAALAAEGQRLAFEPMDHRGIFGSNGSPTIGAIAACNVSGPRRVQAGACRDFMLGVRFVDGQGNIVKNGGRVMKNVTGYDLVKLMAGSYGTLGVLTEVSLKVLPASETRAVLLIEGLDDARAIEAMSEALTSPFDVTGVAHLPVGQDGSPETMIRLEGFEGSVAYRAGKLKEQLGRLGEVSVERDKDRIDATWAYVRDAEAVAGEGDIWKISVKPTDGPEVARRLEPEAYFYDWGGGLIWVRMAEGADVRDRLAGISGHATLVRGSDETKARLGVFEKQDPVVERISTGLREKFDPRGVLNTGLMG